MKKLIFFPILMIILLIPSSVLAKESYEIINRINPFGCLAEASDLCKGRDVEEIYDEIEEWIKVVKSDDAYSLCVIAELMIRVGDNQAEDYYNKAIDADNNEPAFELFFADYLRNIRGPNRPLFAEAEEHYFRALEKLIKIKNSQKFDKTFDDETEKRIKRGLITLYQEDGLPLLYWKSNTIDSRSSIKRPFAFISSINNYAESTTDFDEVDDVRDFTAEALFTSSKKRLNRNLTDDELKGFIREKKQFETLNRLRFRYKYFPVLDINYKYRKLDDAQITNFYKPNEFNDVNLTEYGMSTEKTFGKFLNSNFDFFLKGIYKKCEREGIIEFFPDEKENIDHLEAKTAISRFFGPGKAILEFTYVFQDINPDIKNPPERERQIFAPTLSYQIYSPIPALKSTLETGYGKVFETRGVHLFGGVLYDKEKYGNVDVIKNDFFIGASLKGLGNFDFTIQPTIFTYEVSDDSSQNNKQYRTNATFLYRILDEEKEPGIPKNLLGIYPAFVHVVVPLRHDIGLDGPEDFENFKAGIELNTKFFTKFSDINTSATTFLCSVKYNYQRFYKLDKNLNLFSFNLSMGF